MRIVLILIQWYTSPVAADAQGEVERLLRTKGVRPTSRRLQLLDELAAEPNDVTAQVLWRRLRDRGDSTVGLATVYRTLALLRDHDVVDAMSHHGGELCYRLCTDGHHHHLVCRECHRVVELHDCGLDEWVSRLAAQHGFARPEHHLEIDGVCADCARA